MLFQVSVLGVANHCASGVPDRQPPYATTAGLLTSVVGQTDGWLKGVPSDPWLWNLNSEVFSQIFSFDSPVLCFHHKGVLRPMAVKGHSGCPSVPGFALTLCMERGLDHQPKW